MGDSLLLTATITPPAKAVKLARMDPAQRLRDCMEALEFYLKLPDDVISRIVLVENSSSDLTELQELAAKYAGKQVEFVSFYGLDYPPEYGRAYGEFKLMDYAMSRPQGMLAALGPQDKIWKATGRLRLLNISSMVRAAPKEFDLYCDLRNRRAKWMEMRFYAFTRDGYQKILMGIGERLREDLHNTLAAETLIYPLIYQHIGRELVVPRFRTQPMIAGVSGFENKDYSHGLKNNVKTYTRMVMRRLAPNLWI